MKYGMYYVPYSKINTVTHFWIISLLLPLHIALLSDRYLLPSPKSVSHSKTRRSRASRLSCRDTYGIVH